MWDDGVDRARVWARRVRLGEFGVTRAVFLGGLFDASGKVD